MSNIKGLFSSLNTWIMVYLSFPCLVFIFFWVRMPYSIVLIALLLYALYLHTRGGIDNYVKHFISSTSTQNLAITITLVTFLAVISGAGGYVIQRGDWTKHNVIINDLINYDWPVNYGAGPYVSDTTLVYYLAYYIPPAIVGKLLGNWQSAEIATFIYTCVGILLFAIGIMRFSKNNVWYLLILFGISGIDIIGNVLLGKIPISFTHLESYAPGLQIPSFISQLTWAPQHAISAWLFAYLVFVDIKNSSITRNILLYVGLGLLWSPFVSASIFLVSIPFLWPIKVNKRTIFTSFAGVVFGLVVFLYFKSQVNILNDHMTSYWTYQKSTSQNIIGMIVFLVVDILIFVPLIIAIRRKVSLTEYRLAWWCIIILCVISQTRLGAANDWLLRTTPLLLTILVLILLKNLEYIWSAGRNVRIYATSIFLLGFFTVITQTAVLKDISNPATNEKPDRNMLTAHLKYGVIHQQYMGSASRLFGKLIGNYATSNR